MIPRRQIPNALTVLRLILAVAFFAVLAVYQYQPHAPQLPPGAGTLPGTLPGALPGVLPAAFVLFILAAVSDALDGHLARKWQVISMFGRIVDPLADKVLVIGAFIMLAGANFADSHKLGAGSWFPMVSGVYPWMVVIILMREMLVTTLRATLEGQGVDFSAKKLGKWKMILQSVAVPVILVIVWLDPSRDGWRWLIYPRDILVYATVIVTILSGWPYVATAIKALRPAKQTA